MLNIWMLHPVGQGVTGVFLLLLITFLLQDRFRQRIPKPSAKCFHIHHHISTFLPLLHAPGSVANQRRL